MIGKVIVGGMGQKTNIRFKTVDYFGTYINAVDVDHESEDVIFTGWSYKLNTPQFNIVNRSQYGRR